MILLSFYLVVNSSYCAGGVFWPMVIRPNAFDRAWSFGRQLHALHIPNLHLPPFIWQLFLFCSSNFVWLISTFQFSILYFNFIYFSFCFSFCVSKPFFTAANRLSNLCDSCLHSPLHYERDMSITIYGMSLYSICVWIYAIWLSITASALSLPSTELLPFPVSSQVSSFSAFDSHNFSCYHLQPLQSSNFLYPFSFLWSSGLKTLLFLPHSPRAKCSFPAMNLSRSRLFLFPPHSVKGVSSCIGNKHLCCISHAFA